ncbi:MAG: hypothetical protein FWB74_10445 [Defluviitaleaceae bacterium]|nr:hypothetical protein [Defluviitaleaceae bacterium]
MLTKYEDSTIRTFEEIEKLYPDNFILVHSIDDERGYIVGLSTKTELILADYADFLMESMHPSPDANPFVIAYGKNMSSPLGGIYVV